MANGASTAGWVGGWTRSGGILNIYGQQKGVSKIIPPSLAKMHRFGCAKRYILFTIFFSYVESDLDLTKRCVSLNIMAVNEIWRIEF